MTASVCLTDATKLVFFYYIINVFHSVFEKILHREPVLHKLCFAATGESKLCNLTENVCFEKVTLQIFMTKHKKTFLRSMTLFFLNL